jgi:hypothetical protein
MSNGGGPLAGAAAKISTPSRGGLLGDVSGGIAAFLGGMEQTRRRKEEEALEKSIREFDQMIREGQLGVDTRRADIAEEGLGLEEDRIGAMIRGQDIQKEIAEGKDETDLAIEEMKQQVDRMEMAGLENYATQLGLDVARPTSIESLKLQIKAELDRQNDERQFRNRPADPTQRLSLMSLMSSAQTRLNAVQDSMKQAQDQFEEFASLPGNQILAIERPEAVFEAFQKANPQAAAILQNGVRQSQQIQAEMDEINNALRGSLGIGGVSREMPYGGISLGMDKPPLTEESADELLRETTREALDAGGSLLDRFVEEAKLLGEREFAIVNGEFMKVGKHGMLQGGEVGGVAPSVLPSASAAEMSGAMMPVAADTRPVGAEMQGGAIDPGTILGGQAPGAGIPVSPAPIAAPGPSGAAPGAFEMSGQPASALTPAAEQQNVNQALAPIVGPTPAMDSTVAAAPPPATREDLMAATSASGALSIAKELMVQGMPRHIIMTAIRDPEILKFVADRLPNRI